METERTRDQERVKIGQNRGLSWPQWTSLVSHALGMNLPPAVASAAKAAIAPARPQRQVHLPPPRLWQCYGLKPVARYETCPTPVVWATDKGFIDQMGSLT